MSTEVEVFEVVSGYDKSKNPTKIKVRYMTVGEIKQLNYGHAKWVNYQGMMRDCKINGKVKTWKTRPNDVTVPCKYGLYESFYIGFTEKGGWFANRLVVVINED